MPNILIIPSEGREAGFTPGSTGWALTPDSSCIQQSIAVSTANTLITWLWAYPWKCHSPKEQWIISILFLSVEKVIPLAILNTIQPAQSTVLKFTNFGRGYKI